MAFRRRQTTLTVETARLVARLFLRLEIWLEAEREQLPLWLPVGLVAGISAWFWLPDAATWQAFLLAVAAVMLVGAIWGREKRAGRAVALLALAAALGCGLIWIRAERVGGPVIRRPEVVQFTAGIVRVEPLPARAATRLLIRPMTLSHPTSEEATARRGEDLPPLLRVTVPQEYAPAGLARGAAISLRARLLPPPTAAIPGAYDYAAVAWFAGIGATGRALGPVKLIVPAASGGPSDWLADARQTLTAHIEAQLPGGAGGVAAALVTGDMGAVTESDNDAFRRSGLAHLLSVSGLHLTAAVGATMLVAIRLFALSPWLALRAPLLLIAAGLGALAGIAYTLLTGAEVPTVRSLIAALVVLAGLALGREAMTLRLVAVGALVCVLLWPESVAGPSFQLSFAAILSIVAFHELPWTRRMFEKREEPLIRRSLRSLAELLMTGLMVELALAPIAIFHFHRAGLYGAVANIVAIPLTTFVIMPSEALALLLDIMGIGAPLWWVTGWSIKLLLGIAHSVGSMPGAVTLVPTMSRTAYALIIAGGLWLALWRSRPRLFGFAPILMGVALTLTMRPPDLLISDDGRHLAIRMANGNIALLRERTGDYMRDTLSELSGRDSDEAFALDDMPDASCGPDTCAATLIRGDRLWHLLATRSAYPIDRADFAQACAAADIVVSERRLPGWCHPRWLKADARLLAETGGLAIRLETPFVETVAGLEGRHPWARSTNQRAHLSDDRRSPKQNPFRIATEGVR